VVKVETLTPQGYQPLNPDKVYTAAVNAYMVSGGDGYIMVKDFPSRVDTYVSLKSVIQSLLDRQKAIEPEVEERVAIEN